MDIVIIPIKTRQRLKKEEDAELGKTVKYRKKCCVIF
jgi:hypothetical protein